MLDHSNNMTPDQKQTCYCHLVQLLRDTSCLLNLTYIVHWNVMGSKFYSIHKLTKKIYEEMQEGLDVIAEHIRSMDIKTPTTVEDLDKLINSKINGEKIALATFYNTVHAFTKAGHLKEILTNNNKHYFDTNTNSHHHFFDNKNNELTDIDSKEIKLKTIPTPPSGKKIKDVDVVINIENDSH